MHFLSQIPKNITIIAVTKNQSANNILNLPKRITEIAENRIQEAEQKFSTLTTLTDRKFKKHLIGHLQSNKVKKAIQLFDVIQSVDSFKLAQKINQEAQKNNKIMPIMLQINISTDPNKYGFTTTEIISLINELILLPNIKIIGLMTILAEEQSIKKIEQDFKAMQEFFKKIKQKKSLCKTLKYLSMGMSNDFPQAIKQGSNMIRLGRILFQK